MSSEGFSHPTPTLRPYALMQERISRQTLLHYMLCNITGIITSHSLVENRKLLVRFGVFSQQISNIVATGGRFLFLRSRLGISDALLRDIGFYVFSLPQKKRKLLGRFDGWTITMTPGNSRP